ncbi:unnamed protein product, partial [Amoebophrya sp. A25]
ISYSLANKSGALARAWQGYKALAHHNPLCKKFVPSFDNVYDCIVTATNNFNRLLRGANQDMSIVSFT